MSVAWPCRLFNPSDLPAVERLLDAAFGKDRHGRTAYRLRAGTSQIAELSFVVEVDGAVLGSIQCWPVELRTGEGQTPLVLLGPVGVDPAHQNEGIGRALIRRTLEAADKFGYPPVVLIGDEPYYGPFGFHAAPTQGWTLPGPFDPARLLVRLAAGGVLPDKGEIGPRAV